MQLGERTNFLARQMSLRCRGEVGRTESALYVVMKDSTRLVSFRSDSDDGWSTPECINGSRFMSRGACLFPFIGAREPPKIHSLLLINAPNRYFMRNKYDVRGPLRGPSLSKKKLWNNSVKSISLSLSLFSSFFSLSCLKRNSFGEHFAKS